MRLLDLLKRLEWSADYHGIACCPECEARPSEKERHAPKCELKAAIDHFEQVEQIPPEKRTIEDIRGGQFNPLDHEGMK